jgi:hypothetical protein
MRPKMLSQTASPWPQYTPPRRLGTTAVRKVQKSNGNDLVVTTRKNFGFSRQDMLRSPFFAVRSKIIQIAFPLGSNGSKCVF